MAIDLRKKKTETKSTQPTTNLNAPLPVGQVIIGQDTKLTPMEENILKSAGWKPGEPIPTSITTIVQDAKELIKKEKTAVTEEAKQAIPIAPNTPPLKMPTAIKFENLPQEHQEKIIEEMKKIKVETEEAAKQASLFQSKLLPNVHPSINEAIKTAAIASGANTDEVAKIDTPVEDSKPDLGEKTKPDHKCAHCGWMASKPEPSENPTIEDKRAFLAAYIGGIRFKKTYSLFNGMVRVTFRTLTSEEADMCYTQTAVDHLDLPIDEESNRRFFRTLLDYRLCLSLESISSKKGIITLPDDLHDGWKTDDPPKGQTKLFYILKHVYSDILNTDPIRRTIGMTFTRFQHLVEFMEARVSDENFWGPIE